MTTNTTRLHDLIYDAQADLLNAIEKLEQYVRATDDYEAEAYIVDQLKIIAHRDHGYLAGDLNLDDLMERLDETEELDDADDADDADTPGRYYSSEICRWVTVPAGN